VGVPALEDLAESTMPELLGERVATIPEYEQDTVHLIYRGRTIVILGTHARVHDKKYLAGFVVVDDRQVVRARSVPAPPDADPGRQLEELHSVAAGLIEEFEPAQVAVRVYEAPGLKVRLIAHRGEGAILVAAGRAAVPVSLWYLAGLRKPAGFQGGGTSQECASKLCGELTGEPVATQELEQAAAAAAAAMKKSSR